MQNTWCNDMPRSIIPCQHTTKSRRTMLRCDTKRYDTLISLSMHDMSGLFDLMRHVVWYDRSSHTHTPYDMHKHITHTTRTRTQPASQASFSISIVVFLFLYNHILIMLSYHISHSISLVFSIVLGSQPNHRHWPHRVDDGDHPRVRDQFQGACFKHN